MTTPENLITAHAAVGQVLTMSGVDTFVRQAGTGPTVILDHGVPVSSWAWRRTMTRLTRSSRPWPATIEASTSNPVHLVVHDIGGRIGFEVAATLGKRAQSNQHPRHHRRPHRFP